MLEILHFLCKVFWSKFIINIHLLYSWPFKQIKNFFFKNIVLFFTSISRCFTNAIFHSIMFECKFFSHKIFISCKLEKLLLKKSIKLLKNNLATVRKKIHGSNLTLFNTKFLDSKRKRLSKQQWTLKRLSIEILQNFLHKFHYCLESVQRFWINIQWYCMYSKTCYTFCKFEINMKERNFTKNITVIF